MRLVSCEHPTYIRNRDDEIIQVRCGQCNTCRLARASKWIERLDLEGQQHRFSFMFTLTYDDDTVPALFFDDDMENLVFNRQGAERIPLSELTSLCVNADGSPDVLSLNYLRDRLIHPLGLPCVYTKDISDFCKRFNKFCFSHITNKYENFRYFICHEYGPSTYRPHIHGILYVDDERIAGRFLEVLRACWPFGFANGSAIYSDAGRRYVAQYVNMSMHLPAFYKHPKLRQRQQFSKFPSIGSVDVSPAEVRQLYDECPVNRSVWETESAKYVTIPLESSLKGRFFPKCQGYSKFSLDDRVAIYGVVEAIPSGNFREFRSSLDISLWRSYRCVAPDDLQKVVCYVQFLRDTCLGRDAFENALKRWYVISKRVVYYSHITGYPLSYIVHQIDEFYCKLDYFNLVKFYQFQEAYAIRYSSSHLIWMYPEFVYNLKKILDFNDLDNCDFAKLLHLGMLNVQIYDRLESFGITQVTDIVDYRGTNCFRQMVEQNFKIYKDTHKRVAANAYRDGKLAKVDPQLSCILFNYQSKNILCQKEM